MLFRSLAFRAFVTALILSLVSPSYCPLQGSAEGSVPQAATPANEVRFPVAHAHTGSWCMGYLYISADSIRYEVVRPDKDKKHSFQIARSDLTAVQQWVLLGTPQSATEIKTAHAVYHFWWMPSEDDLQSGQPSHFNPRNAAPPDTLLAALRDPSTVLNGGGTAGQTPGDSGSQAAVAVPGLNPPPASSVEATSGSQPFSTAPAAGESTARSVARGRIGVGVRDVPSSQNKLSGGNGALVMQVEPGGPAAQAGVGIHDVITALNGAPIRRASDVITAMARLAPGSTVDLQILRDGRPLTLTVNVVQAGAPLRSGEPSPITGAAPQSAGLLSDTNDSATELLASGNPPLTNHMVSKGIRLFEWLLDAQLTVEQRSQFRASLVDSWKHHRQDDIDGTMAVLKFQDQLNQKTPQERELIREALREKYLASLRQTPQAVLSRWVLNIYDSAHRPIADGNPPLTLQVADAYAEFVSFMLTECQGRSVFNPDRHFKNALAQSLAAQYSSYSPEQQRQFSQVPLLWELLRLKWSQLSEPERANYRKQWAPAVQTLLASALGSGSGATTRPGGAPETLEEYGNNLSERLFVKSMANSSFTTTMNLHLSMWH